jgi:siroheme synthase
MMKKKGILVFVPKEELKKPTRQQKRILEFISDESSEQFMRETREGGGKILAYRAIEFSDADLKRDGGEMEVLSALTSLSGSDFCAAMDLLLNFAYNLAKNARLPKAKAKKANRTRTRRK